MSTPGVSLFQGTESIKVNTSLERAEEEEALEDQRRRNEELGNLLQNAFDDLEDDETTIDSTTNFQSDVIEHQEHKHHHNNNQAAQDYHHGAMHAFEEEMEQLKMLLDSRNRELENFKQMANDGLKERDEFQKRLTIAEAELDRALSSKKNTHELLVESKEKCSNLENIITKLKADKKSLETDNNTLLGKLETAQSLLSDMQRKYDMVERDLNRNNDRNAELKRKHADERHRAEIEMMQQQIDQIANKLDKKSNELENMNTRYRALQNSHETMLVDKATKINDLNNALNEAQRKCEELLSKQDYFQENLRLQKLVASLQDQIQTMEKTISSLNERLEFTTAELDVMDSVLQQHNKEDTPHRQNQTQGRVVGSTPLNTVDRVGSLKNELYRALANVKNKREEIRRLQRFLEEKQDLIKLLKEEENKALVQITTLKEDKIRVENRLKVLEEEFSEWRSKTLNKNTQQGRVDSLAEEVRQLQEQKSLLDKQCSVLEKDKLTYELNYKKLDANLRNVVVDLEELRQEHESMKLNYEQLMKENQNLRNRNTADNLRLDLEKHKFLLKDAQKECDHLKNLYVEISNAKEELSMELEKLRSLDSNKQLREEREKIENLQRALQLAEFKSSEMTKILEAEKNCHEREIAVLKDKLETERSYNLKELKNSSNSCTKCIEYVAQITQFEIEILQLKTKISTNKKQVDELVQQLHDAKGIITNLTEKLHLSDQQEKLIMELKTKAKLFEEYVKSQSSASDKSLSPASTQTYYSPKAKADKNIATTPELDKRATKEIEARIRDEMAKIFATQLKSYQIQLYQMQEQNLAMEMEYKQVQAELLKRKSDVDLLKQAILAERENICELLKQKESECTEVLQKQKNATIQKLRDELEKKDKQTLDLIKELKERQTQIEAERKSMKAVMTQWEQQRENIDTVESEWKQKVDHLTEVHDRALHALNENYKSLNEKLESAQRLAANHKRYAHDQKAFYKKEMERIKLDQEIKLAEIQAKFFENRKEPVLHTDTESDNSFARRFATPNTTKMFARGGNRKKYNNKENTLNV